MAENPAEPAPPLADEWAARLRSSVQQQRGRFRRSLWIATGLFLGLLAGLVWCFFPTGGLPPMTIVAIDSLCLPEGQGMVRAQFEALDGKSMSAHPADHVEKTQQPGFVANYDVVFRILGGRPDEPSSQVKTEPNGQAVSILRIEPSTASTGYQAQLRPRGNVEGSEDSARIFFRPGGAKIVLVDVQELFADPAHVIGKRDLNLVPENPAFARLLQTLHTRGYTIVYLAIKSDRAQDYRRNRRWRESKNKVLPLGPVLARPSYHDFTPSSLNEDDARRKLIEDLKIHFDLKGITRSTNTAEIYRQAQIPCVVFGDTEQSAKDVLKAIP